MKRLFGIIIALVLVVQFFLIVYYRKASQAGIEGCAAYEKLSEIGAEAIQEGRIGVKSALDGWHNSEWAKGELVTTYERLTELENQFLELKTSGAIGG